MNTNLTQQSNSHTIFVVSGGVGASGEQLVQTVLAQFPTIRAQVILVPNVRFENQIDEVVGRAEMAGATLVHTLVDVKLRTYLVALAARQKVTTIDLMGPLLDRLTEAFGQKPAGHPGLYRKLNKDYFDRVSAIEFTLAHDDGQNPETWSQAEIILVGVSRVGKTPLSLYLSVLGWKVANVPLVLGLKLPRELFKLDRQRIFGLNVEAGQLLLFRQQRQQRLGVYGPSDYTDPDKIYEELQVALEVFQRNSFTVIDVSDKPIETSADEVIRLMTARFKGI